MGAHEPASEGAWKWVFFIVSKIWERRSCHWSSGGLAEQDLEVTALPVSAANHNHNHNHGQNHLNQQHLG